MRHRRQKYLSTGVGNTEIFAGLEEWELLLMLSTRRVCDTTTRMEMPESTGRICKVTLPLQSSVLRNRELLDGPISSYATQWLPFTRLYLGGTSARKLLLAK